MKKPELKQKSINKYGGDVAELATCFINRLHGLIEEQSRGKRSKQVTANSYIIIFQSPYQPE